MVGFVDDLKCILRSQDEFKTLDHIISLFESSSGSRLHRNPETKKCQLLALGRWSAWKQTNSPLNYMKVTEELNILGVRNTGIPRKEVWAWFTRQQDAKQTSLKLLFPRGIRAQSTPTVTCPLKLSIDFQKIDLID